MRNSLTMSERDALIEYADSSLMAEPGVLEVGFVKPDGHALDAMARIAPKVYKEAIKLFEGYKDKEDEHSSESNHLTDSLSLKQGAVLGVLAQVDLFEQAMKLDKGDQANVNQYIEAE